MFLSEAADIYTHQGWKSYILEGHDVAATFLTEDGHYRYGLFELNSTNLEDLKTEILQENSNTNVRFAVINAGEIELKLPRITAFRDDFDFYLFFNMTQERIEILKDELKESMIPLIMLSSLANL